MGDDERLTDEQIERRMNEAVRRALNTPPQPKVGKGAVTTKKPLAKRGKVALGSGKSGDRRQG